MNKIVYIIDIKYKQKINFNLKKMLQDDSEILSLTPYSSYLLDKENIAYKTFHSIISIQEYKNQIFSSYLKIQQLYEDYKEFGYILSRLALVKNYEIFMNIVYDYIKVKKEDKHKIIYISDTKKVDNLSNFDFKSNELSGIYFFDVIEEFKFIDNKDKYFYILNRVKKTFYQMINTKDLFNKVKNKILNIEHNTLRYDHINYNDFWSTQDQRKINNLNLIQKTNNFLEKATNLFLTKHTKTFLSTSYQSIFKDTMDIMDKYNTKTFLLVKPFVYLHNYNDFIMSIIYNKNTIPRVFMQHGSYLYGHAFLEYNEVFPADINFVFNEFTKKSFLKYNPNKVHCVGSINFNKKIKNKKIKYDFLYITHCAYYAHSGMYISIKDSTVSVDGNNIFKKHKEIIELFGKDFKNQTFCIKIQRGIVENMLYVPLLELSKKYKNIKIEFFEPMHSLIEKSKYIISDYFSSEFINRELHYKKDIILFNRVPYSVPEEALEDMKKMFILIDTIDELKDKIKSIEDITKNRKRYDSIIEYYSSKKCDTKKVVTEILEKQFNEK